MNIRLTAGNALMLTAALLGFASDGAANSDGTYIDIAAGSEFTCGLRKSGDMLCWGDDTFGQLGSGDNQRGYPVQNPHSAAIVRVGGGWCK